MNRTREGRRVTKRRSTLGFACFYVLSVASCGGGATATKGCVDPLTLDDFEDGDRFICESGGRKGTWYVSDDGTSKNLSPRGNFASTAIPGGREESQRGVRITGAGFKTWGVWLGMLLNGEDPQLLQGSFDAREVGGVRFWMKSNVPVGVYFPTPETVPVELGGTCADTAADFNCGNFFGFTIAEARPDEWIPYDVPFAAATQPFVIVDDAGNLTAGSAAKDLSHLFEVDFAIDQNQSFDVWIDDISFYNCAGPACLPTCAGPSTPVACPATPGLAAACWPAGTDCAALIALNLISVWGSGPADVWAVGEKGAVVHWDGVRWSPAEVPVVTDLPYYYTHVWGTGPNDVWAVGTRGVIIHWDGARWSPFGSGTDRMLTDLWGSGPDDVWITGSGGTILHWNGATMSTVHDDPSYTLDGIWGSGPDDVWAVGFFGIPFGDSLGGMIAHWNGTTWSETPLGAGTNVQSIWGSGPNDVWAVGARGTIVHWNGTAWVVTPTDTEDAFTGIWGSGPGDIWAVGFKGTIAHWNGLAWSTVTTATQPLANVWGAGPNDVWAVGRKGTILHWDGTAWMPVSTEGLR